MRHARAISPANASRAYVAYGFSPAIQCDRLLITSGLIGLRGDDSMAEGIEEQIESIFGQAAAILATAGGTFADVVAIDSFHAGNIALHDQMEKFMVIRDAHIPRPGPVWTALGIQSLAISGAHLEVRFTAFL
jgi:enamine deaminase RidA (YjgF/YER057c/UK114 family)